MTARDRLAFAAFVAAVLTTWAVLAVGLAR